MQMTWESDQKWQLMQILCVIPHILPENLTKLQRLQMNMCYTSQFTSLSRVAKCKNILIIGLTIDIWSCNILHSLALNWWNGPGVAKKICSLKMAFICWNLKKGLLVSLETENNIFPMAFCILLQWGYLAIGTFKESTKTKVDLTICFQPRVIKYACVYSCDS